MNRHLAKIHRFLDFLLKRLSAKTGGRHKKTMGSPINGKVMRKIK